MLSIYTLLIAPREENISLINKLTNHLTSLRKKISFNNHINI